MKICQTELRVLKHILDINFLNSPGPTPTTTITPNGPNSRPSTADNTVDYTAITPESPNSPGHTPTADNTIQQSLQKVLTHQAIPQLQTTL